MSCDGAVKQHMLEHYVMCAVHKYEPEVQSWNGHDIMDETMAKPNQLQYYFTPPVVVIFETATERIRAHLGSCHSKDISNHDGEEECRTRKIIAQRKVVKRMHSLTSALHHMAPEKKI